MLNCTCINQATFNLCYYIINYHIITFFCIRLYCYKIMKTAKTVCTIYGIFLPSESIYNLWKVLYQILFKMYCRIAFFLIDTVDFQSDREFLNGRSSWQLILDPLHPECSKTFYTTHRCTAGVRGGFPSIRSSFR